MISRILIILGALAAPATALAHPGHVADLGHGHAHWFAYAIGAGAIFTLLGWFGVRLFAAMKSKPAKRT